MRGGTGAPASAPASPLSESAVARVAASVLRFLAQCHAKHIVYRDVKPDNFLFLREEGGGGGGGGSEGGRGAKPSTPSPIRATDFGLAIRHDPATDPPLQSRTGTPVYMAPEVVLQNYGPPCDAWSAGIMIFQLLTGDLPFWKGAELSKLTLQEVWAGVLHTPIDLEGGAAARLPPGARDLLRGLLVRDPKLRWTAAEALEKGAGWLAGGGGGGGAGAVGATAAADAPLDATVVARLQRYATHGRLKQLVLTRLAEDVLGAGGEEAGGGGWPAAAPSPSSPPPLPPRLASAAAAVRSLFAAYDTDASGGIDAGELAAALADRGYDVSAGEVAKLMSRLDADGDGSVSPAELAAGLVDWSGADSACGGAGTGLTSTDGCGGCGTGWAAAWAASTFDELDVDGSGTIDVDELTALLPPGECDGADGGGASAVRAAAADLLREADTDGDGLVSRREFEAMLCEVGNADRLALYDGRLLGAGGGGGRAAKEAGADGEPPPAGGGGALRAVRGAE